MKVSYANDTLFIVAGYKDMIYVQVQVQKNCSGPGLRVSDSLVIQVAAPFVLLRVTLQVAQMSNCIIVSPVAVTGHPPNQSNWYSTVRMVVVQKTQDSQSNETFLNIRKS